MNSEVELMPYTVLERRYHFESAHWLPRVPVGHKCARQHGHNYKLAIFLDGRLDGHGWLIDFWDLDAIVKPLIDQVDHRMLNDIPGLENPTAELIADWFYHRVRVALQNMQLNPAVNQSVEVRAVTVHETDDASATVMRRAKQ